MKKIFKIWINILAVLFGTVAMFAFGACQDIKKLEVNITVYDFDNGKYEEKTLTVDLYRHLAPKTVDGVIAAADEGYYNDVLFYKFSDKNSQIMVGDFKIEDNNIIKQAERPKVEGEFSGNGLNGSNLVNEKGSIGLWRSWTAAAGEFTKSDTGRDSGTAVWYIPTSAISSYDGYFAVFAKIDLENESNAKCLSLLEDVFDSETQYENYTVFYVGENVDSLEMKIIKTSDLNKDDKYNETEKTYDDKKIYEAKGAVLDSYNKTEILVPVIKEEARAARITSVKVK